MIVLQGAFGLWRAGFLFVEAPIIGASVLLLIARLTGADWGTTLRPLLSRTPWLLLGVLPVIAQQALIPRPPHLNLWLSWPLFGLRSLIALGFWTWLARRVIGLGQTGAGLALLTHAVIVDIVAVDWIMGIAPGQPETAIGMVLAVMQILGACAAVCVAGWGQDKSRDDIAQLLIAACLGLAYLLFIDFVVVWYGDLPQRIGWYLVREQPLWVWLPPAALLIGLFGTIVIVAAGGPKRWAGGAALLGMGLSLCWLVIPR